MIVAVEQTYFLGNVLGTFPFSADVSTEEEFFFSSLVVAQRNISASSS